jgi:hypothetical protein
LGGNDLPANLPAPDDTVADDDAVRADALVRFLLLAVTAEFPF